MCIETLKRDFERVWVCVATRSKERLSWEEREEEARGL